MEDVQGQYRWLVRFDTIDPGTSNGDAYEAKLAEIWAPDGQITNDPILSVSATGKEMGEAFERLGKKIRAAITART